MTIGEKIRLIRNFRGLTQSDLGKKIELTGDRIRQYENNVRTPKQDIIDDIAEALEIDPSFLVNHNIDKDIDIIQVLFELEDKHKLDLQKTEDGYTLFIPNTPAPAAHSLLTYLDYWHNIRQKSTPKINDTEEEIASKMTNYKEWKYQFPTNTNTPAYEEYKKMISEIQCKIMMNCIVVRNEDIPMKYSEFIELIKDMLVSKVDMIFSEEQSDDSESLLISFSYSQFQSFTSAQFQLFARFLKLMEYFDERHEDCFVSSHTYRDMIFLDYYISEITIVSFCSLFLDIQNGKYFSSSNESIVSQQYLDILKEYDKIYFMDELFSK